MCASERKGQEIRKDYFLYRGEILPTKQFDMEKASTHPAFYEVIRVIDGVPLFFQDHIDRLWSSMELLGYKPPFDNETIKEQILKLIKVNKSYNYNVKIIINGLNLDRPNLFVYYVLSNYPEARMYEEGVDTILCRAERDQPNAKLIAADFRAKVNRRIEKSNVYEALLVNNQGQITEGSRSNTFFVKDDTFYTAPEEDVLVGITRSRIIQLCRELGYRVVEGHINVDFLNSIDGLFLTGTSPKVLPIATVDEHNYRSSENHAIRAIHDAYNRLIDDYIAQNK